MEVRGGADAGGGAIVTPDSGDFTCPPGAKERRALDEDRVQRSDKALAAMAAEANLFFAFAVTVADVNGAIVPEKTPKLAHI